MLNAVMGMTIYPEEMAVKLLMLDQVMMKLHGDDVVDKLIGRTENDILYGTSINDFLDGDPG